MTPPLPFTDLAPGAANMLLALAAFAFASSITPGPNNMMLLASGVNFGLRRTVPHLLGVSLGHAFMVFLVGIGLAGVFVAVPSLSLLLKVVSAVYMLWLAWKIATAAPRQADTPVGRPFSFMQAAAFQWVNPKAWAMALTATTLYAPGPSAWNMAQVALVFGLINLPSVWTWAALGHSLRAWLAQGARLRAFNITMGLLLVASLWPVMMH